DPEFGCQAALRDARIFLDGLEQLEVPACFDVHIRLVHGQPFKSSQTMSRSFAMARAATRPTTSFNWRAGMPVPGRFAQTSSGVMVAPAAMSRIDTTLWCAMLRTSCSPG